MLHTQTPTLPCHVCIYKHTIVSTAESCTECCINNRGYFLQGLLVNSLYYSYSILLSTRAMLRPSLCRVFALGKQRYVSATCVGGSWLQGTSPGSPGTSSRSISTSQCRLADTKPLVTVITGCSSGIGLATAALFAKDPQRRFIVYGSILDSLEKETLFRETADTALNDTLIPLSLDVTKDESVEEAVAMVMEQQGRIDILVNNAGIGSQKALETLSMPKIKRVFEVNFFGTMRMIRAILPIMKRQMSGRIVNMSSRNAIEGAPYMNVYTASKFAIEGLSEETAVLGRFFNIWVSLIQPGLVESQILATMIKDDMGYKGSLGISDHPDVHELDRRISTFRDNDFAWSECPMIPAEAVAEIILEATTAEKPHFRYQTQESTKALAARKYRDMTGDEFIEYQVEKLRPFAEGTYKPDS